MKVSIKKISEKTGFSPATVSNALNYKRGVNAETADAVRKAAQELGYFEEKRITKIRFVIFKTNGSIVDETPYFTQLISGVEQECRACGMEMQVCNLCRSDSGYREEARRLFQDQTSGIILLANEMTEEDQDLIRGVSVPLLLIDYWKEGDEFDSLAANNTDSVRLAVEYLIGKGHTEIGYLRGEFRIKPFQARGAGYQDAMQRASLPVKKEYEITLPTGMESSYLAMRHYLENSPKLATAYFADNDIIALGAMKAMEEAGIRIPEDVSVVGFDDLTFSAISSPPLTTIRVPKQEMGRVAVRRIRDIIQQNDDFRLKMQICTQFIVRSSVRQL